MKVLLLDANVLLALAWPHHPFHQRAVTRLARRERHLRAICLLTQLLSSGSPAIPQ